MHNKRYMNNKHPKRTKSVAGRSKKAAQKSSKVFHGSMVATVAVALGALVIVQYVGARMTMTSDAISPSLSILEILASLNIYALWIAGLAMFVVAIYTLGREQGKDGFLKPFGHVMRRVLVFMVLPAVVVTVLLVAMISSL